MPDELLEELDAVEAEHGYSGRSDVVRTALEGLLAETRNQESLNGVIDGVLLVIHDDAHAEELYELRHTYEHVVSTQMHHHLQNHKGLELFILRGEAEDVKKFHKDVQTSKHVAYANLVTP